MNSIGDQLKSARKAKGLSLDDIAKTTRINRKYLEELEQNITPQLPPTYVNAFLKAFAREVGLDLNKKTEPVSTERSFRISLDAEKITHGISDRSTEHSPPQVSETPVERPKRKSKSMFLILILLVAGLVVSIIMLREEKLPPPQEVSFSDVVKEQEAKAALLNAVKDSFSMSDSKKIIVADSLLLEGVASESVWVHIVIDGMKTSELIFPPAKHMKWKAMKNFVVSIGNAEGMAFTLNGKRLGALGTTTKPLRNYIISQDNLRKLPPAPKVNNAKP